MTDGQGKKLIRGANFPPVFALHSARASIILQYKANDSL